MSGKAEEYQTSYEECFKVYDASPESTVESLRYLVEDMIQTIRELEQSTSKEHQAKRLKQEASARTGIYE